MVMGAAYLRDNAAIQIQAMQMGQPKYLSYEDGRQANIITTSAIVVERVWTYWARRAKKAMPDLT